MQSVGARRRWVLLALTLVIGTVLVLFAYAAGHRAGRGSGCVEVALNTRDALGRSLKSEFMSKLDAQWSDDFFSGQHCTVGIGFVERGRLDGGRWRYALEEAKLYADDENALRLFPASGLWRP